MNLTSLDETIAALTRYGFDAALNAHFATRAAHPVDNAAKGQLRPVPATTMPELPALGTPQRARLRQLGAELIKANKVGVVILAGGMATRFGGVVKAVVPARGNQSFLELKHHDIATLAGSLGAQIPTLVMSSFATHDIIETHIVQRRLRTAKLSIEVFPQMSALRLTLDGQLFRDASGALSPYSTGHGDLSFALRASGQLARFRNAGGTTLFMTNVDNVGATLDPAMIALHHELGAAISVEVVRKLPGAVGGAPALCDGVPQIIEGFRFPPDFDQNQIAVFNTNTLILDAAAIDRDFELPYYRVEKNVDGATVVQFERLVGELTAFVPSRFVRVAQVGADCRFLPIKEPEDLTRHRAMIERIAISRRGLTELGKYEIAE